MLKKTVVIGSEEFKKAVLDVLKESKEFVNDIENPRFERLKDGWVRDHEAELDWGPGSAEGMNFTKAQEYCNSLGGRLPTVDELQTILDPSMIDPACDKNIFKDVKSEWYWTSTKYVKTSNASWCVSFYNGRVGSGSVYYNYYVRPVRASQ